MSYASKKEYIKAAKALKSKMNKKKNKKYSNQDTIDIMKDTKEWNYGQNPQKKCKLGRNSILQRLCSHHIRNSIKIPKKCNLSFCTGCCRSSKGINRCCKLNRYQQPYCQFNLVQSILNSFPNPSSYNSPGLFSFFKQAILSKLLNHSSSSNQLVITINNKISHCFFIKEIKRDAMAKAFDVSQVCELCDS